MACTLRVDPYLYAVTSAPGQVAAIELMGYAVGCDSVVVRVTQAAGLPEEARTVDASSGVWRARFPAQRDYECGALDEQLELWVLCAAGNCGEVRKTGGLLVRCSPDECPKVSKTLEPRVADGCVEG